MNTAEFSQIPWRSAMACALVAIASLQSAWAIQPGTEREPSSRQSVTERVERNERVERTVVRDRGDTYEITTDRNGTDVKVNGKQVRHVGSNTPHREVVSDYDKGGAQRVSSTRERGGEGAAKGHKEKAAKEPAPRRERMIRGG